MGYYKRIRDLREDHDLTQRQLAARLRMTQTQYFRYEQGYRDIPSDILIALADLYGTSTDYILARKYLFITGSMPAVVPARIEVELVGATASR